MTLYRKATDQERQDFINYGTPEIVVRAVIPVELCEHGTNVYRHFYPGSVANQFNDRGWCEGAGLP